MENKKLSKKEEAELRKKYEILKRKMCFKISEQIKEDERKKREEEIATYENPIKFSELNFGDQFIYDGWPYVKAKRPGKRKPYAFQIQYNEKEEMAYLFHIPMERFDDDEVVNKIEDKIPVTYVGNGKKWEKMYYSDKYCNLISIFGGAKL